MAKAALRDVENYIMNALFSHRLKALFGYFGVPPSPLRNTILCRGFGPKLKAAIITCRRVNLEKGESKMVKRSLLSTAIIAALATFLSLSAMAQTPKPIHPGTGRAGTAAPVGTEEPCISNPCLFYAGDFDVNGPVPSGQWNGYNPLFGGVDGTIYVPFTVPKAYVGAKGKTDWNVEGLFVNELLDDVFGVGIGVSSADWSIVQGVAQNGFPVGGTMTTICSGTGIPTVTPTGRSGFGASEYTILITGIACPLLEAGTYWMTLVPTTEDEPYLNDVEDNTPANAEGPGTEPADDSYYYSQFFGFYSFQPIVPMVCGANAGCDKFSVGIIGTAVR